MQQWQLVQHCFSENSDKVDELSTAVQRLSFLFEEVSLLLEEERTFSAELNAGFREFSESASRRFDAIDQNVKEQLVTERNVRERQFQTLPDIVWEELQARMVDMFEEGLFRERTTREDSNVQLRKSSRWREQSGKDKMLREIVRERRAREQLRDRIEHRMELISCLSGTRSSTNNESARELMQLGTAPKFRSEADANATFATAVTNTSMTPMDSSTEDMDVPSAHQTGSPPPCTLQLLSGPKFVCGTGGAIGIEEDCRLEGGEKRLKANGGNPANLTGTWRLDSKNGWTRDSRPAVQLNTQQQQQRKYASVIVGAKTPARSGSRTPHKSSSVRTVTTWCRHVKLPPQAD